MSGFNFGTNATGSGGLFGNSTPATTAGTATSGVSFGGTPAGSGFSFGGGLPAATTSAGGLFGAVAPATQQASLFGAGAPAGQPATSAQAPQGAFSFAPSTTSSAAVAAAPAFGSAGFSFGAPAAQPTTAQPQAMFGTPTQSAGASIFGTQSQGSPALFGTPSNSGTAASSAATSTPSLFGAPRTNSNANVAGQSLFGAGQAAPSSAVGTSLFGQVAGAPAATVGQIPAQPQTTIPGRSLFGPTGQAPSFTSPASHPASTQQSGQPLFGAVSQTAPVAPFSFTNPAGATSQVAAPAVPLFGNASGVPSQPGVSGQAPRPVGVPQTSIFGGQPSMTSTTAAAVAPQSSQQQPATIQFGQASAAAPSASLFAPRPTTAAVTTTSNLFPGGFVAPAAPPNSQVAASVASQPAAVSTGLFSHLGSSSQSSFGSVAPATVAKATASAGLFGVPGTSTTAAASNVAASVFGATVAPTPVIASSESALPTAQGFGVNTTVPPPSTIGPASSLFPGTPTSVPKSTPAASTAASLGSSFVTSAVAALPGVAKSTAVSGANGTGAPATSTAATMTYGQLEEMINKWKGELEEQEKTFLHQATQINAWDRVLVDNNQKIVKVYDSVEQLNADHGRVEQELDFITSQQNELDDILSSLEKQTAGLTLSNKASIAGGIAGGYAHHADVQRKQMADLAVKVDSQMKQMGQDFTSLVDGIKDVTEQRAADKPDDPLQQISKILGKQIDTLQWVDQNTNLLQEKLREICAQIDDRRNISFG